jgi:hypothetical protein
MKVKMLLAAVAGALVVGIPAVSVAAAGGFGSPGGLRASGGFGSALGVQQSKWTTTPVTTSSTSFKRIASLSGFNECAINQVTVTLSVELSGAPASFGVRVDGGGLMQPQAVRFVPAGAHDSSSFTFVTSVSTFENNDHHSFDVEWRSPTGKAATLERATANLMYQIGSQNC